MKVKPNYFYMRQGWSIIAPVFGFGNFIMLIYMTLDIEIPLYIFAPVLTLGILTLLIYLGKLFMGRQQATDLNLSYFNAQEAIKTELVLWEQMTLLCESNHVPLSDNFKERNERLESALK